METAEYVLPEKVWLRQGRIYWRPVDLWQPVSYPTARFGVGEFQRFLALETASDEEILEFAREYGPVTTFSQEMDIRVRTEEEKRVGETVGEAADEWRQLARTAGAILRISANHRDGKTAKSTDWAVIYGISQSLGGRRNLGFEMALVAGQVNQWLRNGHVGPALLPTADHKLKIVLSGQKLRGALAIQLLQQIGGTQLAACSGCHKFYFPTRAPRTGQDNFCEVCRKAGVPVARAKHRQYLKPKLKKVRQHGRTINKKKK